MILNRFGVRGKLNLLLLLPVIAVLLVATPLVVTQIDDARAAGRTADTAGQARDVGGLVWELQRELLVTSAYVASPEADSSTMLQQQRAVTDSVERVRASLGPTVSDELAGALTRVGSLNELRRNAVTRGVSLDSLARTYHAVTEAVIDALRLLPRSATGAAGTDAESTKALGELEALLRADEQSALRSTALITTSVNPVGGRKLLNDATANAQILTQRFVQQADIGHAALLVQVDQGDAGRKIEALSRQVPDVSRQVPDVSRKVPDVGGQQAVTSAFVRDALAAAESQAGLRRAMQDRVTAEIADAAATRGAAARNLAIGVGVGVLALVGLVVLLSVIVSRSIADPLRQLTRSATHRGRPDEYRADPGFRQRGCRREDATARGGRRPPRRRGGRARRGVQPSPGDGSRTARAAVDEPAQRQPDVRQCRPPNAEPRATAARGGRRVGAQRTEPHAAGAPLPAGPPLDPVATQCRQAARHRRFPGAGNDRPAHRPRDRSAVGTRRDRGLQARPVRQPVPRHLDLTGSVRRRAALRRAAGECHCILAAGHPDRRQRPDPERQHLSGAPR